MMYWISNISTDRACQQSDVWCLMFDVWCLMSYVWCLMSGVWCLVSVSMSPIFTCAQKERFRDLTFCKKITSLKWTIETAAHINHWVPSCLLRVIIKDWVEIHELVTPWFMTQMDIWVTAWNGTPSFLLATASHYYVLESAVAGCSINIWVTIQGGELIQWNKVYIW